MRICVFCSANDNLEPSYYDCAAELGRWMAANGHTLVFGGTDMGLMETVARAVKESGGRVEGVVPRRVESRGRLSQRMDVYIPCEDLSDRKAIMMERSDAFVALPGGIGTLDEVFTVAASATLGYHRKPLVLYDVDGFWTPVVTALDALADRKVIRGQWRDIVTVAATIDEVTEAVGR